ncbi:NAD-binding protein [uncultured Methanoregula sp.]|uniref:potassium channel family protein n=1 Tax=uncultured Methanoregula sp. TaxID=1005933 RepID=UPI002AAA8AF6|nr:NAD-binding protein [uncultured Methanoregula sp.]
MTMRILIVGGGKVGTYLAGLLLADGHTVKVVEGGKEEYRLMAAELPADVVLFGSVTDPEVLETAGIREADVVAAVTRTDETNLVITSLARFEFNVQRTIARVNIPKNAWLFTPEMGVDVPLNQADLMAHLIAEEMSMGDVMTLLKLRRGQYSLVENKVSSRAIAAGKAIKDLNLPSECVLPAIIRNGNLIIPRGDTVLLPEDEVFALVHVSQLDALASILR